MYVFIQILYFIVKKRIFWPSAHSLTMNTNIHINLQKFLKKFEYQYPKTINLHVLYVVYNFSAQCKTGRTFANRPSTFASSNLTYKRTHGGKVFLWFFCFEISLPSHTCDTSQVNTKVYSSHTAPNYRLSRIISNYSLGRNIFAKRNKFYIWINPVGIIKTGRLFWCLPSLSGPGLAGFDLGEEFGGPTPASPDDALPGLCTLPAWIVGDVCCANLLLFPPPTPALLKYTPLLCRSSICCWAAAKLFRFCRLVKPPKLFNCLSCDATVAAPPAFVLNFDMVKSSGWSFSPGGAPPVFWWCGWWWWPARARCGLGCCSNMGMSSKAMPSFVWRCQKLCARKSMVLLFSWPLIDFGVVSRLLFIWRWVVGDVSTHRRTVSLL